MNPEIKSLLERGIVEVIVKSSLEEKLSRGEKLRVKLGIDPTGPDIHLGHTVPLRKLKAFQEMGHTAVFIIGDFTARIGDPSEKEQTRKPLTTEEVKKNADGFFEQAFKLIDKDKTEVHLQSEWFEKMDLEKLFDLARKVSVAQLMEHETFKKRIANNAPFSFLEMMYPILQGYDSVAVRADVEIGASEQKYNLLMGRQVQKLYGQDQQDVIMMHYLIGLDGKEKMSKSLGNYIAVNDAPDEMYGKVMSIPDELIVHYYELCTDITTGGLDVIKEELRTGKNPRDIKAELAKLLVEAYHSSRSAEEAAKEFNRVFRQKEFPSKMTEFTIHEKYAHWSFISLLSKVFPDVSNSELRRLIFQGGVELDGMKISDPNFLVRPKNNSVLKVGKKRFIKLKVNF